MFPIISLVFLILGIRLPLLCDICTMGKPNVGKQMARAGMRCTLCVLSLAMIVLPIIDG